LRKTLLSDKHKRKWMQILIYLTGDGICIGYIDCPYRRLLDILNNVSSSAISDSNEDYLRLKEARMDWLNRRETAEIASISKGDILFVKPTGYDSVSLVPKQSKRIRLHLPSYILTGQIHYHRGRPWRTALDSIFNFFPITNVEIASKESNIKCEAPYVAVNKKHVSSVEETGTFKVIRI
jgi:hypothetical protein